MATHKDGSRRFRFGPLGCVLVLLAIFVLLPATLFLAYRLRSGSQVRQTLAVLRARGEPTTAQELEEFYALPPGATDTAPLWLAAVTPLETKTYTDSAGQLPVVGVGEGDVPLPGQPWPEQEAAEQHLARYAESLEKMHQAAAVGGPGRYPINFDEGFSMLLPHVQSLRAGARLLSFDARVQARRGDAHAAAESIHAMFQAAESLELEPVLISQLVRVAIAGMAAGTIEDLLPAVEFSDEDLARLQADLDKLQFQGGVERAMLGERAMGTEAIRNPASLANDIGPMAAKGVGLTRQDDLALYLQVMSQYVVALRKPWPEARREAAAVNQELEQHIRSPIGKFRYALTGLLSPAMEAIPDAGARGDALNTVTATAIAAERYRRSTGQAPQNLGELVPQFLAKVPTDPFDGQPLRYKSDADGQTVYSIGRNGVDDGGQEKDNTADPDIVVHLPAAKSE